MYIEFENAEEIRDAAAEALGKYVAAEHIHPAHDRLKIFCWRDMLALKGHITALEKELGSPQDIEKVKIRLRQIILQLLEDH